MASSFGESTRRMASDIVKRRRGNPDPDGVIASQVANRIVQNSSSEIGQFLESMPKPQAFAPGPIPTPEPMPLPEPPWMEALRSGSGAAGRGALIDAQSALIPPLSNDTNTRRELTPRGMGRHGIPEPVMPEFDFKGMPPMYEDGSVDIGIPPFYRRYPEVKESPVRMGRTPEPVVPRMPPLYGAPEPGPLSPPGQEPIDPQLLMILQELGLI